MDLRIIVLNCNSLNSKLSEVKLLVDDVKPELVCLTETWLTKGEPKFKNYKCEWKHRLDRVGGGLGILIKGNLQCDKVNLSPFNNGVLEVQAINLHLRNGTKLSILNYYNPNKDVRLTEFQHYLNTFPAKGPTGGSPVAILGSEGAHRWFPSYYNNRV